MLFRHPNGAILQLGLRGSEKTKRKTSGDEKGGFGPKQQICDAYREKLTASATPHSRDVSGRDHTSLLGPTSAPLDG